MVKVLTTLLVFLLSANVFAKERTENEMQKIALLYLYGTTVNSTRASATNLSKVVAKDLVCLYASKGHGFVVVSKDDDFCPVLGVSSSDYISGQMPCGFNWWLSQVDKSLKDRKERGETYQVVSYAASNSTYFLRTYWDQMEPFNFLCPKINNQNAPTGCLATAMAQIMYYYKYPEQGKGVGTYTVSGDETPQQLNINSIYDWNNMKLRYTSYADPGYAVSTLMRDAGASCHMNYAAEGSGAVDADAAVGFCNNFKYDSLAINSYSREFYSDEEWMGMINKEMLAQRPILYGGQDNVDGGHAFILDGIREDGKVHVNWGWSGSANGWYDINVLKPYKLNFPMVNGDGFNSAQSMIIGYKAQETPDIKEENTSLWVTTAGYGFKIEDNKLIATLTNAFNLSFRYFSGVVDIVLIDTKDENNVQVSNVIDTKENNEVVSWGHGFSLTINGESETDYDLSEDFPNIPAGTYHLFLASKSTAESSYQYVRSEGGPNIYILTVDNNGNKSLVKDENSSTQIINIKADNNISKESHLYDINGVQISKNNTGHGIFIMKQGNKATKIIK